MIKEKVINWLVEQLTSSCTFNDFLNSKILEFYKNKTLSIHRVWGDKKRIYLGRSVQLNDALINTVSGDVKLGDYTFCGHGVSFLTGTHDISKYEQERQHTVPTQGRDINIGKGVWIASHAIIIGPCEIGDNSIIGAGAIVTGKVEANIIYTHTANKTKKKISGTKND